jgi:hypothetical protein
VAHVFGALHGEAMQAVDHQDHETTPQATAGTNRTAAANTAHLAKLLRAEPYPSS